MCEFYIGMHMYLRFFYYSSTTTNYNMGDGDQVSTMLLMCICFMLCSGIVLQTYSSYETGLFDKLLKK